MKKKILFIIALFTTISMSAQFYGSFGLGYALGASKRVNGIEISGTKTTNLYDSYGQGFSTSIRFGIMFNDNMGVEMGVRYLLGASLIKHKETGILEEAKASGLQLLPQLVYRLDNGFYGRFGIILPIDGKTLITESNDITKLQKETITRGAFSPGFAGAIGFSFQINDKLSFYSEIEYIDLSIKSGSAEITKYEVAGVDQLTNMKTCQKEYTFLDEVDDASDNVPQTPSATNPLGLPKDVDEPTVMLRQKAPFSSLGLNIGLIMRF